MGFFLCRFSATLLLALSFEAALYAANPLSFFKKFSDDAPVSSPAVTAPEVSAASSSAPRDADLAQLERTGKAFSRVAQKATAAVVNISTVKVISQMAPGFTTPFGENDPFYDFFGDDFFRRFFQTPQRRNYKQRSLGSGVIIDRRGYILTNNHVIEGADEIKVTLLDRREFTGKVIGSDPKTDLAVIKIETQENLPTVTLADSDQIEVGEWAIAIGNPFGLNQTVTVGIISAKGRADLRIVDYEDFIQTDAAINPGNSGGALLNIRGELIGINTAIFSRSGGYQGIGFAIPANMAKKVMAELIQHGKITRGWLGISIQEITPELAAQFNIKANKGVLVGGFLEPSPAKKAGIQVGDIIIQIDDKPIATVAELRNKIADTPVGNRMKIEVARNGSRLSYSVKIAAMPDEPKPELQMETQGPTGSSLLGMAVTPLSTDIAQELGIEYEKGLVVSDVVEGGPAAEAGIQRGDLIKEVNKSSVKDLGDYQKVLARVNDGDQVLILFKRGAYTQFVVIQAQK